MRITIYAMVQHTLPIDTVHWLLWYGASMKWPQTRSFSVFDIPYGWAATAEIMDNQMKIKRLSSRALHHHFIFIGFEGALWMSVFLCPCFSFLSLMFVNFHYIVVSLFLSHIHYPSLAPAILIVFVFAPLILSFRFFSQSDFWVTMRASNAVYLCNMSTLQTHITTTTTTKNESRKKTQHQWWRRSNNKLGYFW